jgi:hypothetical protein
MSSSSFNALIFIPDISGFTKFVNKTSIEHSSAIIKELLEIIMAENKLDLKLVEIEGDALLYYKKQSNTENISEILEQCKSMFLAFHQHLKLYERDRICNCEACSGTHKLGLKFIVHSGEIALQKIMDHKKIMGKEVILAHRLMKNDVDSDNYVLLSNTLPAEHGKVELQFSSGESEYPEIGNVSYNYSDITNWIKETPALPEHKPIKYISNPLRVSIDIDKDINFVHSFLVSMKHRKEWNPDLIDFIYDEDKVDRIGSAHDCILPNNTVHITTVANEKGKKGITFAERVDKLGIIPESFQLFKLEKIDDNRCRLIVENHTKLFFPLNLIFKAKLKKAITKGIGLFKNLCETKWTEEDISIQY